MHTRLSSYVTGLHLSQVLCAFLAHIVQKCLFSPVRFTSVPNTPGLLDDGQRQLSDSHGLQDDAQRLTKIMKTFGSSPHRNGSIARNLGDHKLLLRAEYLFPTISLVYGRSKDLCYHGCHFADNGAGIKSVVGHD